MTEPTEEERRNGWTAESLRAYRAERERAQAETALHRKPPPPQVQNNQYSVHRWRK